MPLCTCAGSFLLRIALLYQYMLAIITLALNIYKLQTQNTFFMVKAKYFPKINRINPHMFLHSSRFFFTPLQCV